ncbi:ComF family protein [Campylobacter sp. faydin G-140]|uniref:ComF family protein n=1 Tax=Campylobacter anatolicus TaxID=2829105 RepID=UPI001B9C076C|nr:ComF family protein [Campylobacter anatolicus]MBR8464973.1 ComF family protein [Campylobacter anatolicus]
MRCFSCSCFTFGVFCRSCREILSTPNVAVREVKDRQNELRIYSFYDYSDIKCLIHSKHQMHGLFAYKALANLSFKQFALNFTTQTPLNVVPIDDRIIHGYSHTAILARAMKSLNLKPLYRCLHATSHISYSGQTLKFRQNNPRKFKLLNHPKYPVILVDDIITTGTTLLEAKTTLERNGFDVLCGIVLADARY